MDFSACIAMLSTLNIDCWFYWFIALSFSCCTSISLIVSEMCSTTRVTTVFTSHCSSLGKKYNCRKWRSSRTERWCAFSELPCWLIKNDSEAVGPSEVRYPRKPLLCTVYIMAARFVQLKAAAAQWYCSRWLLQLRVR